MKTTRDIFLQFFSFSFFFLKYRFSGLFRETYFTLVMFWQLCYHTTLRYQWIFQPFKILGFARQLGNQFLTTQPFTLYTQKKLRGKSVFIVSMECWSHVHVCSMRGAWLLVWLQSKQNTRVSHIHSLDVGGIVCHFATSTTPQGMTQRTPFQKLLIRFFLPAAKKLTAFVNNGKNAPMSRIK